MPFPLRLILEPVDLQSLAASYGIQRCFDAVKSFQHKKMR